MTPSRHFEGYIMFSTEYGSLFSDKTYTTVDLCLLECQHLFLVCVLALSSIFLLYSIINFNMCCADV